LLCTNTLAYLFVSSIVNGATVMFPPANIRLA
jgi:hypothetical protein